MNRKERIDLLVKELDEQHQPDKRFKESIKPIIDLLYDAGTPEDQLDNLFNLVRETYERNRGHASNYVAEEVEQRSKETCTNNEYLASDLSDSKKKLDNTISTAEEIIKMGNSFNSTIKETVQKINQTTDTLKNSGNEQETTYIKPSKLN